MEHHGWIAPAIVDISLILFAGGAMRLERRPIDGPWKGLYVHQEDLILRSGTGTSYEVRWKGLSSASTRTLHLRLSRDLVLRTAEEVAGLDPSHLSLTERFGFQDSLLSQIGLALWRELEQRSPAGKLYADTAAQMLAVHIIRHYSTSPVLVREPYQGLTRRQVKQVTDFILAHLAQDLSLEALAQQAGFSAYHFARLFRQTTGESPHQFVLRQRIAEAQRLLTETGLPLARIAVETGFANQSHFTRIFKRQLGLTPRAYRRETAISARLCQDPQE